MLVLQRFESDMKVLFDTFSFKNKYENLVAFHAAHGAKSGKIALPNVRLLADFFDRLGPAADFRSGPLRLFCRSALYCSSNIVTMREMWELQHFGSDMKVLF